MYVMPTTRQLEIFIAVASGGSFRHAAELLDISQPSVSKQIQAIEKEIGGSLFQRRRGARAELSPLGQTVLQDANRLLQQQKRFVENSRSSVSGEEVTIFIRHFLLETIKRRWEEFSDRGLPQSTKFVIIDDHTEMIQRVRATKSSLGLLRLVAPLHGSETPAALVGTQPCSLYATPEIADAVNTGILCRSELTVRLLPKGSEPSKWAVAILEAAGLDPENFVYGPQFVEALVADVLEGKGAGVFMDFHVRDLLNAGRLAKIDIPIGSVYLYLLIHPDIDQQIASRFLEIFRTV